MTTAPSDHVTTAPGPARAVRLGRVPEQRTDMDNALRHLVKEAIGFPDPAPARATGTVAAFFDLDSELSRDQLHPRTVELLRAHTSAGHQVWLVTAQPSGTAEALAHRLGATGWISAEPHHERGKAARVAQQAEQDGIDLSASYAYADSVRGLPLLESVGHPGAVNPDPMLHRIALVRRWRRHTFRWRSGTVLSVAAPTAALVGAVVVAAFRRRSTHRPVPR
jgi:phosphoserine phosphatase